MGNRAFVAFKDQQNQKPQVGVYMHWNGGAESIYAILDVLKERNCMSHSAGYTAARFAHLACTLLNSDGLSVGVEPYTTPMQMANCADDNGLYVFCITDATMERYVTTGYASQPRKLTPAEISTEARLARKHKYWENDDIRNTLRKAFPEEKKAA